MIKEIITEASDKFGIVLILMTIDLVTGLWKAYKSEKRISSSKLRNSVNKMVVYFVVMVIGGCVFVSGNQQVLNLLLTFVVLIEGVSIVENLEEIFPNLPIVSKLKNILRREQQKGEEK